MSLVSRPIKAGDHVFLVDGSSFVFRAYFPVDPAGREIQHADRRPADRRRAALLRPSCSSSSAKARPAIAPTHLAIIFDKSENSFRKELYPAYKEQPERAARGPRPAVPPDALRRARLRARARSSRTPTRPTTSSRPMRPRPAAKGADVLIISADKDLMQLDRAGRDRCTIPPPATQRKRGLARPSA